MQYMTKVQSVWDIFDAESYILYLGDILGHYISSSSGGIFCDLFIFHNGVMSVTLYWTIKHGDGQI